MRSHPAWTPDGLHYARAMLQFRGKSADAAQREARDFFATTEIGRSTSYHATLATDPTGSFAAVGSFFTLRVAYPWLAALLYAHFGFNALIYVSILSYAAAGLAMYALILLYAPAWMACLAGLIFLASPSVRSLGASSLVDMLAIAIWFIVLYAMLRFVTHGGYVWFTLFTLAAIALSATRPFIYVPFAAALFVVIEARLDRNARRLSRGVALLGCTFFVGVAYIVLGSAMGSPSIVADLQWMQARDLETGAPLPHSFIAWYATRLGKTSLRLLGDAAYSILPLFALVGFALRGARSNWLFAGIVMGAFLTLLLDPSSGDLSRTIEIPLYPLVLIGIAAGIGALREDRALRHSHARLPADN